MEPLASRIVVPDILLDRQSREPLHQQITRQIAGAIREGKLRRHMRLPSTRSLARLLGVSRNVAIVAYEALTADGLIRSMHGSGAWINQFAPISLPPIRGLLSAAMYPERLSLFADPDGNLLYIRHPDWR